MVIMALLVYIATRQRNQPFFPSARISHERLRRRIYTELVSRPPRFSGPERPPGHLFQEADLGAHRADAKEHRHPPPGLVHCRGTPGRVRAQHGLKCPAARRLIPESEARLHFPPNLTSMAPQRIQRKRTAGFRLQAQSPDGRLVKSVSRPGKWGNPFHAQSIDCHCTQPCACHTAGNYVARYRRWLLARLREQPDWLEPLRGLHLACFCGLNQPCHADFQLEMANRPLDAPLPEA